MAMATEVKNNIDSIVLSIVGHPLRRAIIREVSKKSKGQFIPKSPKMMSDSMDEKLANVAYHVRCLVDAEVLKLVDTPQRRGAIEHFYVRSEHPINKQIDKILRLVGKV